MQKAFPMPPKGRAAAAFRPLLLGLLLTALTATVGCGSRKVQKQNKDFFTSGSREADQRASQRMAKDEQLAGSGEGAGEKGVKKAVPARHAAGGPSADATRDIGQDRWILSMVSAAARGPKLEERIGIHRTGLQEE